MFQFADNNNSTSLNDISRRTEATPMNNDEIEPNNNHPEAVNANLYPKLLVSAAQQATTVKLQPTLAVIAASDGESDLSSVTRILNVASPASLGMLFTPTVPTVSTAAIAAGSSTTMKDSQELNDDHSAAENSSDDQSVRANDVSRFKISICLLR